MIQPKQAIEATQKPLSVEKADGRVKIVPSCENTDRILYEDEDIVERLYSPPLAFVVLYAQVCICGVILVLGAIAWALWLRR